MATHRPASDRDQSHPRRPRQPICYLTRTEREASLEHHAAWRLYRLRDLSAAPGLSVLPPPLEASVTREAETWQAVF